MKYLLLALALICTSFNYKKTSEYAIEMIYTGSIPKSDVRAVIKDDLSSIDYLLTPAELKAGKYIVNVTKTCDDLYKVDGKNIFIQTRYCYKYSYGEEVILIVESNYGYTKGKVIFD